MCLEKVADLSEDMRNVEEVPVPCENPEEVIREKLEKDDKEKVIVSLIFDYNVCKEIHTVYTELYTVETLIKCIVGNLKHHNNIVCIIEDKTYQFYRA